MYDAISALGYMTAGVRQCLYVWSVNTGDLLQTLDAHFGRILKLISLENENVVVSSSIDHSIKMWNMNNVLEQSYPVQRLEKSIDAVLLPIDHQNLAITQTRKYVSVWNTVHNRVVCSLAASVHGAVVTNMACTPDCRFILTVECETLLLWQLKTQSVIRRCPAQKVMQLMVLDKNNLVIVVTKGSEENRSCTVCGRDLDLLSQKYSYTFACMTYRDVALMKGDELLAAIVLSKLARPCIELIHAITGLPLYKIRIRKPNDFEIDRLIALPHNPNQVAVISSQHSGMLWDVKNRKPVRTLPKFSGICTTDGKVGAYAPPKGGLQLIEMRKGQQLRTLIPFTLQGFVEAVVKICPIDKYILYYHNTKRTLSLFRISNGFLLGTFVPHAQLTSFVMTSDSKKLLIGGEDGSLVCCAVVDAEVADETNNLAVQPGREYLAEELGLQTKHDDDWINNQLDLAAHNIAKRAVKRFKALLNKNKQKSAMCLIQ